MERPEAKARGEGRVNGSAWESLRLVEVHVCLHSCRSCVVYLAMLKGLSTRAHSCACVAKLHLFHTLQFIIFQILATVPLCSPKTESACSTSFLRPLFSRFTRCEPKLRSLKTRGQISWY